MRRLVFLRENERTNERNERKKIQISKYQSRQDRMAGKKEKEEGKK